MLNIKFIYRFRVLKIKRCVINNYIEINEVINE